MLTAALRASGPLAIDLKDGATTGAHFRSYVADTLAPALRPGDTVIMDNLSVHKVAGVREALETVGDRLLYLPPYSPDFNPIEQLPKAEQRCPDGACVELKKIDGPAHVYSLYRQPPHNNDPATAIAFKHLRKK